MSLLMERYCLRGNRATACDHNFRNVEAYNAVAELQCLSFVAYATQSHPVPSPLVSTSTDSPCYSLPIVHPGVRKPCSSCVYEVRAIRVVTSQPVIVTGKAVQQHDHPSYPIDLHVRLGIVSTPFLPVARFVGERDTRM